MFSRSQIHLHLTKCERTQVCTQVRTHRTRHRTRMECMDMPLGMERCQVLGNE